MRGLIAVVSAVALLGCATSTPVPHMRPLNQQHIATMGETRVAVAENNWGVTKSWFMTDSSAAGAGYGLIGAIVSATMDAIINAGPSRRARQAADEIAELIPVDELNASLVQAFQNRTVAAEAAAAQAAAEAAAAQAAAEAAAAQAAAAAAQAEAGAAPAEAVVQEAVVVPITAEPVAAPVAAGVRFSEIITVQKITAPDPIDDAIEVVVSYTLSEDASVLRVQAAAAYQNPETPYATPYAFESAVPKAEKEGPAYRNVFTFYSRPMSIPVLTPELRERLIENIRESARDENGALPAEDTDEFRAMNRELESAADNELTKNEIAIFLVREWVRDDGARLRAEIADAHDFIARYVLLDMNRTAVPSMEGRDELVETRQSDGRTVRRIGVGVEAGSYVSSPANVTAFSTYGNAVGVARVHQDRMQALRAARRRD